MHFQFQILAKEGRARAGELRTPHGTILTPNFNPVGTQATVKSLSSLDLQEIGAQIVLANTYHLHLRPGADVIEKLGGLGKFMNWRGPARNDSKQSCVSGGPTMTDSGGYQVFSLGNAHSAGSNRDENNKRMSKFSKSVFVYGPEEESVISEIPSQRIKPAIIDDSGVTFYSHLDGTKKRLDPEISIRLQEQIGADLIVAFDDHESPVWNFEDTKKSLERTNRWGLESLQAQKINSQLMYGVVHGGLHEDLRIESAKFTDKHFPAIAIGGAYTSKEILYSVLDWCVPHFQDDKPRHLLGIGEVADLFEGVGRGMDFFDCVAPTRRARHGNLYVSPKAGGRPQNNFCLPIQNAHFARDTKPIDPVCLCKTCQNFSRAYLHHLFRAKELLAYRLASYHNVYFIVRLMQDMRSAILEGRFGNMKNKWVG